MGAGANLKVDQREKEKKKTERAFEREARCKTKAFEKEGKEIKPEGAARFEGGTIIKGIKAPGNDF